MAPSFGIIGSGPMAVYLLKHLVNESDALNITVLEASDTPGIGMPYRPGMNADFMLCNAFSREIPSVTQPLVEWLRSLPERELSEWEMSPADLSARAFYPRVLLGEYFGAEFLALCDLARSRGHAVRVLPRHRVIDIVPAPDATTCVVKTPKGLEKFTFSTLAIATGHHWPDAPTIGSAALVSPWPATTLEHIPAKRVGILGSSLSAIDIAVALGHAHGTFQEDGAQIKWFPNDGSHDLRLTMVSRKGIMPEADFYYPFPYAPLQRLTAANVAAEVAKGSDGLLSRVFDLLLQELDASDPDYLDGLGPQARTIAGFSDGYFARRQDLGGLRALRTTLTESRASMQRKETVAHRAVLLHGHEEFDGALRALSPEDWEMFATHLMPVFADCYAAVPHLSVARVLALFEAGVLDLVATGDDATFEGTNEGGVSVHLADEMIELDLMIDARGQPQADLSDLPFPSLVPSLSPDQTHLEAPFRLHLTGPASEFAPIYCLSMPQVMVRYPFSQGLANCATLSKLAALDAVATAPTPVEPA